jgi:cysteine-rich repeat protein
MGRALVLLALLAVAHDGPRDHPLAAFGEHAAVIDGDATIRVVNGALVIDRDAAQLSVGDDVVLVVGARSVRIVEHEAHGSPRHVRSAVAIERTNGHSYWTVAAGPGFEEWLDVDGATSDQPIASWSIEGASFRAIDADASCLVVAADGSVIARVEATDAWTTSGHAVHPTLRVENDRLALYVPTSSERMLVDPVWVPTGTMAAPHVATEAPTLAAQVSGAVIVASSNMGTGAMLTERYDTATGVWSAAAPPLLTHYDYTMTQLTDGRVLVAGGYPTTAEVYDPSLDHWTRTGTMSLGHHLHTATRLADGRVLVVGGYGNTGVPCLGTSEIYDPSTNAWTATTTLPEGRCWHSAVLLTDGRVLVVGGGPGNGPVYSSAWLFSPTTGTWTATSSLPYNAARMSATLLSNGRVLVVGGLGSSGALSSAATFDPTRNNWTAVGGLLGPRQDHSATLLADGRVLIVGGLAASGALATTEYYFPSSGASAPGPSMTTARFDHFYALLPNGRVLVAGGDLDTSGRGTATAEVLVEDTCGNGVLDTGESCDDGNHTNGDCCSGLCEIEPAGTVCRAAAGGCDVAEVCDGTTTTCPADSLRPAAFVCRPSIGECDLAEQCAGGTSACPPDAAQPAGTTCGPAPSGACDAPDTCSGGVGASATCTSVFVAAGTPCGAGASCSLGTQTSSSICSGSAAICPAPAMRGCSPYVCGATACLTSCTSTADCVAGLACVGTSCMAIDAWSSPDVGVRVDAAADDAAVVDAARSIDAASSIDAGSDASTRDAGRDGSSADAISTLDAATPPTSHPSCGCSVPARGGHRHGFGLILAAWIARALLRRARRRDRP